MSKEKEELKEEEGAKVEVIDSSKADFNFDDLVDGDPQAEFTGELSEDDFKQEDNLEDVLSEEDEEEDDKEGEDDKSEEPPKQDEKQEEEEEDAPLSSEESEQEIKRRNYEGLNDLELASVKKLKNYAYEKVKPLVESHKTLREKVQQLEQQISMSEKGTVPLSYYENEQAFTLSPKYQELSSKFDRADYEKEFHSNELIKFRKGEPYRMIVDWDSKTGQPIVSQPRTPEDDPIGDTRLQDLISNSSTQQAAIKREASELQASFKATREAATTRVRQIMEQHYNNLIEPLRPAKEEMQAIKQRNIPAEFQDHPLSDLASASIAVVIRQAKLLQKAHQRLAAKSKTQDDRELAGPRKNKTKGNSASRQNSSVIDLEKLEEDFS